MGETGQVQAFEEIEEQFCAFHAAFAPAFRRKQWRKRSQDYLRGLLVQSEERGNAENLSEAVPNASARVLQRFLTEARWSDTRVIERLQEYAGERLNHPEAVWAVDESGVVKQGKKSCGVARQYCGAVGKVANCQMGVYLSYNSPKGRLLVDKRLYLPREWTQDPERCEAAGVPEEEQHYRSKTELALCLLQQAKRWGYLQARWVTGDDGYGESPSFRDGVDAEGFLFVLEVPGNTPVWPVEAQWETPVWKGRGRPPAPKPTPGQWQTVEKRAASLPKHAWRAITVGEGAQGPRTYLFACERRRDSRDGTPGREVWVIYRKALDGSEPRYYFSNAPLDTPLDEMARVSAARWPIETEFEDTKSLVGLGDYEVRSWQGWHHHITCCLLANAFLLTLQEVLQQETLQQEALKKGGPHASGRWPTSEQPTSGYPTAGLPDCARTAAKKALEQGRTAVVADGHPTKERSRQVISCQASSE